MLSRYSLSEKISGRKLQFLDLIKNWNCFRDYSMNRLHEVALDFKQSNPKKFKKKQDITFVGIHHRRGDHLKFQIESGFKPLEAAYFFEAMELYRQRFKRVVFVYVTDDIEWGIEKIGKILFNLFS